MTIILRSEKGTPLTSNEVDGNFIDLDGRVSTAKQRADDAHSLAGQAKTVADAAQVKLVAGSNITIDVTDPNAPVISASGGGGTGTVQTVAGVEPVEGDVPSAGLIAALGIDGKLPVSQKAAPNGVASLDSSGKVPVAQLPSYVDDVLEFFTLAAMPRPGESGKIYIALNTNKQYRWPEAGSDYVELVASPGTTDAITEGAVNKWWTNARTLASVLTGIVFTTGATITATDSVLSAFGKLQKQITDAVTSLGNKANSGVNADITQLTSIDATGYNVLRTGLPVMTGATSGAIGAKGLVPTPSAGDQLKFLRADGTWVTVSASAVWGSISGTLSDQTDLSAALNGKIASTLIDFVFIYPNGGSASSPATISLNTRLINNNPFPGSSVICEVECLVSGVWETPGWVSSSTQSPNSIGVKSSQRRGGSSDEIITQSGSIASITGGGYTGGSYSGAYTTAALPVRVKVWKVKS